MRVFWKEANDQPAGAPDGHEGNEERVLAEGRRELLAAAAFQPSSTRWCSACNWRSSFVVIDILYRSK
jgi:hypothetical protein